MNKQSKKDLGAIVIAALIGCSIFATAVFRSELAATILYSMFTVFCVGMYSLQEWEVVKS